MYSRFYFNMCFVKCCGVSLREAGDEPVSGAPLALPMPPLAMVSAEVVVPEGAVPGGGMSPAFWLFLLSVGLLQAIALLSMNMVRSFFIMGVAIELCQNNFQAPRLSSRRG